MARSSPALDCVLRKFLMAHHIAPATFCAPDQLSRLSVRTCGQTQIVAGFFERDSQVARYPDKKFSPLVLRRWLSIIGLFEKLNKFLFCHKTNPRKGKQSSPNETMFQRMLLTKPNTNALVLLPTSKNAIPIRSSPVALGSSLPG